jgi:hypothetical protein
MKTLLFTLAAGLMVNTGSSGQPLYAGKTADLTSIGQAVVERTDVVSVSAARQAAQSENADRTWTNFRDSTVYYVAPRPPI